MKEIQLKSFEARNLEIENSLSVNPVIQSKTILSILSNKAKFDH